MKIHVVDGNNVLRRKVEAEGPYVIKDLYVNSFTKTLAGESVIWVWDGKNAKQARRNILAEYKEGDGNTTDEFYKFMSEFKKLMSHSKAIQVELEGYEGDDLIAQIVNFKAADTEVFIDSNDQDFRQLLKDSTITLEYNAPKFDGIPYDDIRIYKTLCGDSADNIKGLKGFGPKTFAKLNDNQKTLIEQFILGEVELDEAEVKAQIGFTPAMVKNFINSRDLLNKYWNIVGFLWIDGAKLSQAMKLGDGDMAAAQKILDVLAIDKDIPSMATA